LGSAAALAALTREPDPLAVRHAGRDVHLERPLPSPGGQRHGTAPTGERLLDGQRQLRLLVRPGHRAEAAARSGAAAEHAPQQVVDVDVAGGETEVPVAEVRAGEDALALPPAPAGSGPLPRCLPLAGAGPHPLPGLGIHSFGNLPEA